MIKRYISIQTMDDGRPLDRRIYHRSIMAVSVEDAVQQLTEYVRQSHQGMDYIVVPGAQSVRVLDKQGETFRVYEVE